MREVIQRPDLIHRVQQFFGLRDSGIMRHLSEDVSAVVVIGDVREVADEKVISRPCAGAIIGQSSFAGSHFTIGIRNPAASAVVVRVTAIEYNSQYPVSIVLEQPLATAIGAAVPDLSFRDLVAPGPKPGAELSGTEGLGFPGPIHYLMQPAPAARDWGTGWTLYPGAQLRLDNFDLSGSGQTQYYGFLWTESTRRSS